FGNDRRIQIDRYPAVRAQEPDRMRHDVPAVDVLPLRISGRKMEADIAEGGCAEEGVCDRVEQNIGVGVSGEPAVEGDGHSAEHHRAIGGEAMDIVPDAAAWIAHACVLLT